MSDPTRAREHLSFARTLVRVALLTSPIAVAALAVCVWAPDLPGTLLSLLFLVSFVWAAVDVVGFWIGAFVSLVYLANPAARRPAVRLLALSLVSLLPFALWYGLFLRAVFSV